MARAKPFTDEEEEKEIVTDAQKDPGNTWAETLAEIAARFPGRSIPFTDEEKKIVTDGQRELGNKWTKIAERLPGRSMKQVKGWCYNRLHAQRQREKVLRMERTGQEEERGAKRAKSESQEAKEGPLTEEERKIVNDAQKELGNKWTEIAELLPGRSGQQVGDHWHRHNQPRAIEGPFTDEEKRIVTDAQKELGNKWAKIAERLPGRSRKQVQDHWHKRLYAQRQRDLVEGPFTDEEKRIVTDAQKELGNKWTQIAERLPGRSMRQVRDWWRNRRVQREGEGGLHKEGRFSEEERKIVTNAQKELGNKWTVIAERLPGRSRKQIQGHWHRHNQPRAIEGPFTDEEKRIVTDAQKELGNKWTQIAERLPGWSGRQVNKMWYRERERATHNQARAIEGPFTDEEKKIVMDAQKELGNKWSEIAERLPGRSGRQVNSWWHSQIRSEKRKRKRRREEEGSATPGPPPKIGLKREKTESQEGKVGGMSLSEGGGAPKDDIESVDAHDASPRIGASGELDGPREEAQCVGISNQIIAQNKRQMAEPEGGGGGLRKEGPFSEEERKIVMKARRDLGNRWTKIAERLPGRSGKQVNQWWHTQIRSEKRARKRMQEEETRRVTRAKTELQEAKEGLVAEEDKRIVNDAQKEPGNKRAEIVERLPGGPAEKRRAVVDGMSDCRKGGGDRGMSHNQWMHTMRLCEMAPRRHGTSHARLANTLESQKQTIAQDEQRMAAMTNLHARQNMSRAAFEQATRTMRPNQLMLPRNRTTHKAMTDAIDQAIAQEVQHTASANDLHARTEGSTNAARTQRQNVAQEELRTAAMANLHARENINGTTFGQTIEMCLHQLALRGNGMTHEAMADAIDQAIAQEVQRTALTNKLHAP